VQTLACVGVLAVVAVLVTARSLGHDASVAGGRAAASVVAFVLALLVSGLAPFTESTQAVDVLVAVGHLLVALGLWWTFRTALVVVGGGR